jgi:lipopolysaccharide export system protein LptA
MFMKKSKWMWVVASGVLVAALAGCGGGAATDSESRQVAQKRLQGDADAAKKQLNEVRGVTMKGGELSGGDSQGHPLWRISAKEIRVFNETAASPKNPLPNAGEGEGSKTEINAKLRAMSAQPKRAELTEARALLYKNGKLDSTFLAPRATLNYTPTGVRLTMTQGMSAQSAGGWTGKRGPVSMTAPRAEVDVKTRRIWASNGVRMTQGTAGNRVFVSANQMRGDVNLKTAQLLGSIKATAPKGKFSANQAAFNWQTNRASAQGAVTATHEGTTISGARLEADTVAGRGVLTGGVRASGQQGKATASSVRYDWKNHALVASGGVQLAKDEVSLQANEIAADDKFDAAVASGGVTLRKGDATLRAGRIDTRGKGETATASGGMTLVKGDATISASRATAYNLGSNNVSVSALGEVRLKRGDLTLTAGAAQATGLQDRSTLRVVASDGVRAQSKDGEMRASRATWGGGQIVASGGVTLLRDGNRLSGSRLVCDDKFNQAVMTGDITGRLAKGETISAGKLTYRKGVGVVADDGVSARRGELRLRADHLTSTPDGNHIVLTGNVIITNEQGARVLSQEARYDRVAQKIYASGDVYLQDPKRGLRQRGRKLVADLKLNKATLEGVSGSGRMNVFSDKKLF